MFDSIIATTDYAAIGALCLTAWLAGRRTALHAPRDAGDPPPEELRLASAPEAQAPYSEVKPRETERKLPEGALAQGTFALQEWSARELEAALVEEAEPCGPALILTRNHEYGEPLPARLADPLTPQVMSRYQLVAQECKAPSAFKPTLQAASQQPVQPSSS